MTFFAGRLGVDVGIIGHVMVYTSELTVISLAEPEHVTAMKMMMTVRITPPWEGTSHFSKSAVFSIHRRTSQDCKFSGPWASHAPCASAIRP